MSWIGKKYNQVTSDPSAMTALGAGAAGAAGVAGAETGLLASMGPLGWGALGLLAAKRLGIF